MSTINDLSIGGQSAAVGLVAHAGGGQALATALTATINSLTTVTTANDSAGLPVAQPGAIVIIENLSANSAQVYGSPTSLDTINGVATATGVALPGTKRGIYFVTVPAVFTPGVAGAAGTYTPGKWGCIIN